MGLFDKLFGKPNIEKLGKESDVKGLIKALRYKDENIQSQAIESLSKIGNGEEIEPLISVLYDRNKNVRQQAADVLEKKGWKPSNELQSVVIVIGKANWEKLSEIPLLNLITLWEESSQIPQRPYGVDILSFQIGTLWEIGKSDVSPLLDALTDRKRVFSRILAANALGVIGDSRCLMPLANIFKDSSEDVLLRKATPVALQCCALNNEAAVEPVLSILADSNSHRDMRISATRILATIGRPSLKSLIKELKNDDPEVRAFSAMAIVSIGEPNAVREIKELRNDQNEYVREIAELFSQVIENPSFESYMSLMNLDHDSFRLAAVNALGNIGNIEAIDVLANATRSLNENIQTDAFFALGKMIKNPDVKAFFSDAIYDKSFEISFPASMILLKSGISLLRLL